MVLLANWRSDERRRRVAGGIAAPSDGGDGPIRSGDADPDDDDQVTGQSARRSRRLKARLVLIDFFMVLAAWSVVLWTSPGIVADTGVVRLALGTGALVLIAMLSLALQHLYRSRVCAVRQVESARLLRVGLVTAAVGVVVLPRLGLRLHPGHVVVGAIVLVVLLGSARSVFSSWLQLRRSAGAFQRPLVIAGTNPEARHLERLIQVHPELGYRLCGVIGDVAEWDRSGMTVPWLGPVTDAAEITRRLRAGVLMAVTSFDATALSALIRDLMAADVAVHISTGLTRIDHRRIRALPLASEPMFYIEAPVTSTLQAVLRRSIDIAVGGLALVVVSPVLALAVLATKIDGRGSVLFRQRRIGKDGKPFVMLKLRTMVPGADRARQDLGHLNERSDGPLFKVASDPRITRVGRWLRALSIDELPQLVNVLRGDMSLVGPRPPIPDEADEFDDELFDRFSVRPGITGLWQLEARDNPAFDAYRRLDLFYIENRTIGMDLAILWGTFGAVVSHALHSLRRDAVSPAVERRTPLPPAPPHVALSLQGAGDEHACSVGDVLGQWAAPARDVPGTAGVGSSTM